MGRPNPGMRATVGRWAPVGTRRRAALTRLVDRRSSRMHREYSRWMAQVEPHGEASSADPTTGPLISVIVPTFNTPERYLAPMVDSVLAQTYPRWELCLADGSTDPARARAVESQSARDGRIRRIPLKGNQGIAGNTTAGIDAAVGDYVAFLDHDDTLARFALNEIAAALYQAPGIDLFYSDEDKLSDNGQRRLHPFFKPPWSPDLFYCVNYLAHFVVARTSLVRAVGGVRPDYEGAQDYDLLLRLVEAGATIHHVPRVSYHWRMAHGSHARSTTAKRQAQESGRRALQEHLTRMGLAAAVQPLAPESTSYRVHYTLPDPAPTLHLVGTETALVTLQESTPNLPYRRLESVGALGYAAPGDIVVLMEAAGRPENSECLADLAAVALRPPAGLVGPALVNPDGAELTRNMRWWPPGGSSWPREVGRISGFGAVRAELARELVTSGAELTLASLSEAARSRGRRNILWPFSRLVLDTREDWTPATGLPDDPYRNPNVGPDGSLTPPSAEG